MHFQCTCGIVVIGVIGAGASLCLLLLLLLAAAGPLFVVVVISFAPKEPKQICSKQKIIIKIIKEKK